MVEQHDSITERLFFNPYMQLRLIMKAKLLTALLIIGCFSIPAFAEYQLFTTIDQANQWCPRTDLLRFDRVLHRVYGYGPKYRLDFTSIETVAPPKVTGNNFIANATFRLVEGGRAPVSRYGFVDDTQTVCYYSYLKADGGDYALVMTSFR